MSVFDTYFKRFSVPRAMLQEPVSERLGIAVAIPCHNEPDIIRTLDSIRTCAMPSCAVEVIVAVNFSETASAAVRQRETLCYEALCAYGTRYSHEKMKFLAIFASDLPRKFAGVGLARKIAMDEAMHRFAAIGNERGIIASCDADSLVEHNYLVEIERFYAANPGITAATIHFEHPLQGDLPPKQYAAIAQYELYMRHYVRQLARIGFPHARHTMGSSFSLTAKAYCRQGGMNKRQAGEDFYFLQKLFINEHVGTITGTKTIPSARISNRIPFGTGTALSKLMEMESPTYFTFAGEAFEALHHLFAALPRLYMTDSLHGFYQSLHPSVRDFVPFNEFAQKIEELRNNSASEQQFVKRFFAWFNGFMVYKYLNFAHTKYFAKVPVVTAAAELLGIRETDAFALLALYRQAEAATRF